MLTEKDYCDNETAWELCALGYPGTAFTLLYLAQKWLREERGMHIEINLQFLSEEKRWYWGFTIIYFDNPDLVTINGDYSSYEEALSEGIKEAIKILKENGKAN